MGPAIDSYASIEVGFRRNYSQNSYILMMLCAKWHWLSFAALCQRLQRLWAAIASHFRHIWQRWRHLDVSHLHIASCVYLCNCAALTDGHHLVRNLVASPVHVPGLRCLDGSS